MHPKTHAEPLASPAIPKHPPARHPPAKPAGQTSISRADTSPDRYEPSRTPGGDDRDRTDDPLLAKQVLSQLSYVPGLRPRNRRRQKRQPTAEGHLVGQGGFEPPTPRLSSVCSNQLSY